ncbi:MAG: methionine--tRNA ligase, partial [Ruminococcus sp.]|nr:methionine--tRNA ligase [Ruminococcus sp.]
MCEKCNKKPYYITTAIAYTSRKPHIGNSYEIVLTDAIARYKRMQGYDVFFQTGTDEHGQKIEMYAQSEDCSPKEYVDKISGEIRDICDVLNTSYDYFIRTTDPQHEKTVQKIFKKLYEQGDIYKGSYEGLYCTPCESFWTETQLVDGKCPDCGREVKPTKEEAYFLRLSKYQKQLEEYIESHPDFIYPESRKKEMLNNFIKPGLQDLCVSRTSFKWGIPVDFDPNHVVYVWIDALSNYITSLGYDPDGSSEKYKKYWPADAHIVGKDIVRFHTIYWPIMLMALGQPLPKQVFGHPWLLFGEDKMSKSRGNVIYADELVKLIGVDAVRYYLLSEMPFGNDGSASYETIIERFNSDLANTLGNLVNRTIAMNKKYFDGIVQSPVCPEPLDDELKQLCLDTVKKVDDCISSFHISDAVETVMNLAKRCNKYIDETAPWVLAKDEAKRERLGTVLYNLLEAIRYVAVLLQPFMPDSHKAILSQLNCDIADYDSLAEFGRTVAGTKLGDPVPLFVRIDPEKLYEQIVEMQKANAA